MLRFIWRRSRLCFRAIVFLAAALRWVVIDWCVKIRFNYLVVFGSFETCTIYTRSSKTWKHTWKVCVKSWTWSPSSSTLARTLFALFRYFLILKQIIVLFKNIILRPRSCRQRPCACSSTLHQPSRTARIRGVVCLCLCLCLCLRVCVCVCVCLCLCLCMSFFSLTFFPHKHLRSFIFINKKILAVLKETDQGLTIPEIVGKVYKVFSLLLFLLLLFLFTFLISPFQLLFLFAC